MKQAKLIHASASQITWALSVPHDGHSYVVSSVATVMGVPEAYLFPADEFGTVLDYLELSGSQRGTSDHIQVLREIGYEVGR